MLELLESEYRDLTTTNPDHDTHMSSTAFSRSLEQRYNSVVARTHQEDPEQRKIVRVLAQIGNRVLEQENSSSLSRTFGMLLPFKRKYATKGLYLWGGVGRGKTFLMDLFFESLPISRKRRLHFHHFMLHVHNRLTQISGKENPLQTIAAEMSSESRVLCFDEFFVSDIGDAMILSELLDGLFARGLVLVTTSNVEPKHLYRNGLQRRRFLPAIALIENHTRVLSLEGTTDYRLATLQQREMYRLNYPVSQQDVELDVNTLTRTSRQTTDPLRINEREIQMVFQAKEVAGFTFHALCETARSANDYIEIARLFQTIVLYDVPVLTNRSESAARRFIALIDELYDRHVNVIFYAQTEIGDLYQGERLILEFKRTHSRILEMQSDTYLSKPHKP